jgi:hypothetical protein
MATDAIAKLSECISATFTVATGQTVTGGKFVKHSGSDTDITDASADDFLAIGVAHDHGRKGEAYVAGDKVKVYLSNCIVPVKVGTGDCTRGKRARIVATGVTDAPAAVAGGGTAIPLVGQFMQSGVAGDVVGLKLEQGDRVIT